jgi:hypothetical protein
MYRIFMEGRGLRTRTLPVSAGNDNRKNSTPASLKIATTDKTNTQYERAHPKINNKVASLPASDSS